jgi:KTSC domain-containing protein
VPIDKFQPKSSFIEQVEYDDQQRLMTLTFKNGTSYRYLFVFPATYQTFKESNNHSVYYSRLIKGKLLSVPIVKKAVGKRLSTPLHHQPSNRSKVNGNRIEPARGLIPASLSHYVVRLEHTAKPRRKRNTAG